MAAYTIHLRNEVRKVPRYLRAKKAITAVREFVSRHSKTHDIRIGKHLNLKLWEQGIKNPVTSVKIDIEKDGKGVARAELFGAPKDAPKPETKKGKAAKAAEKNAAVESAAAASEKKETATAEAKESEEKTAKKTQSKAVKAETSNTQQ
jgi:large subunit ribosomal protein L31e